MRLPSIFAVAAAIATGVGAERMLRSTSLNLCQPESGFSASLFDVTYTPSNNLASVDMNAISTIEGYVQFDFTILAYGYEIIHMVINPCETDQLKGFCPMQTGRMTVPFTIPNISPDVPKRIPGIAFTVPDLDAKVRVFINKTEGNLGSVACLETSVTNGQTVDLVGVKWAAAAVAGCALLSSALLSALGFTNAASHVAANAVSLLGYFQAQAMVGLLALSLPPIAQAWTQDMMWSMGLIRVGFLQNIFTWYQRATGGTPTQLVTSLSRVSVSVQKRGLDLVESLAPATLGKRAQVDVDQAGSYVVTGIQRAGFRAKIEPSNIFLTTWFFFVFFLIVGSLCIVLLKGLVELLARLRFPAVRDSEYISDFRNGWKLVLRGVMYRTFLVGFAPVCVFSLWEFTQRDSAGELALAVFFLVGVVGSLYWAAWQIIRIARRSITMHGTPAYILFCDLQCLNRWGFLYIPYRATAYYALVPLLTYTLIKSFFLGLSQHSGIVQMVALILLEAAAMIAATVLKPWMDKKTTAFNVAIFIMNFINSLFVLIFSEVFDQPKIIKGVAGVLFWVFNAAFTLVYLLLLIVTTVVVLLRNDPDARYRQMADDRTSFMKSASRLNLDASAQLDALGATARGNTDLRLDTATPVSRKAGSMYEDVPSEDGHQQEKRPGSSRLGRMEMERMSRTDVDRLSRMSFPRDADSPADSHPSERTRFIGRAS